MVTQTILILLIGVKIVYPVVLNTKSILKEVSLISEDGDNDEQKKGDTNAGLEKELAWLDNNVAGHTLWYTYINHITIYFNNYCTAHYLEITIPPPDVC